MDKTMRKKLQFFFKVLLEEADANEEFSKKLLQALYGESKEGEAPKKKRSHRRDPAVLDPVQMILDGDESLETRLRDLTEKQLKDIIADYSMDPSKLASRWRKKDRLVLFILERARHKASKGDAFRE